MCEAGRFSLLLLLVSLLTNGGVLLRTVSIGEFLRRPGAIAQEASVGEFTTVRFANGRAAVIIDEPEWTMLRQALALCVEHPEFVLEKSNG